MAVGWLAWNPHRVCRQDLFLILWDANADADLGLEVGLDVDIDVALDDISIDCVVFAADYCCRY